MNGSRQQSTRILHLALVGGVVLALAAFAVVRRVGAAPSLDAASARTVARLAIVLVIVAVATSMAWGRRGEREATEDDPSGRRALGSLLVRWVLVEGAALFAGIGWLVTGVPWVLAAAIAALAVLALSSPGRGPA